MKKILFILSLFLHNVVFAQENTDKFEYKLVQLNDFILSPAGTFDNIQKKFEDSLNNLGKEGWEIIDGSNISIKFTPAQMTGANNNPASWSLESNIVLKRKIYNTKQDIENQAATYVKQYGDSLRTDIMTQINQMTWSEMGKYYKQEIVDDIMKKVEARLNDMQGKIIDSITNKPQNKPK